MLSQPNRFGNITVWPRLEIGNSSVTPWSTPSTIAWKVDHVGSGAATLITSVDGSESF